MTIRAAAPPKKGEGVASAHWRQLPCAFDRAHTKQLPRPPMSTRTEASVATDSLRARARAGLPAIGRRPAMPAWFADAPDGLDIAAKQRRFDELRAQARRSADAGAILAVACQAPLWLLLGRHDGVALLIGTVAVPLVLLAAMAFARKPLLNRLLCQHVKAHATR